MQCACRDAKPEEEYKLEDYAENMHELVSGHRAKLASAQPPRQRHAGGSSRGGLKRSGKVEMRCCCAL